MHPHGKAHVLYVGHTPPFPLAGSLLRGGWSVTHADPSRLASGVDPEADVVVLDNIAIGDVEEAGWRALAQAVRKRGTGLVLLGGKRSLGAGGYRHSTLESLLPVTAQASADPELATAIFLIDKSGSMDRAAAGRSAFAYAREAVQLTAASLEGDRIGITTFDVNARVLLPVGTHEDFAAAAKRAWRDVRPGGGTLLTSGLTSALDQFDETNGQKLLILVTDGFTEAHGDDSTAGLTHLADTIARKRVDIIALGIGADASLASLQQLTTANDGVLLQLDDVAHIPRLMLAATGAKRGAVEEGAILPVQRQPLPFLALAPETRWPMLRGYTVTRPRADATVYLETARGDPLVVTGHAGLGHVVVLTGGLGRWAGAWHKWPQWGALAAGLVEWSAQSPSANLHLDLVRETESYRIIADVMDQAGNWVAAYDGMLPAHLAGPDDIHRELSLSATAPGRYDAALPLTREGRYRLTVGSGDVAERRDFHYEATAEHAGGEGKLGAWREAALITPLEDYDASRHETRRPLRTLLTAAALLFYCASLVPLINRANHPHPRPHRS